MSLVSAVCHRLACYCPSPSGPTAPPLVDVGSVCCLPSFGFAFVPAHPIPPPLPWSMLLVSAVCCRLVRYCPSPSHPTTPPMVDVASVCCLLSFGLLLFQPIPSHRPSYGQHFYFVVLLGKSDWGCCFFYFAVRCAYGVVNPGNPRTAPNGFVWVKGLKIWIDKKTRRTKCSQIFTIHPCLGNRVVVRAVTDSMLFWCCVRGAPKTPRALRRKAA